MSYSKEVPCARCDGTGKVWEYSARDLLFGMPDVPDHTFEVDCPECLGQGHVRENPKPEPTNEP